MDSTKKLALLLASGFLSAGVYAAPVSQIQVQEVQGTPVTRRAESAQSELVIMVQQLQAEVRDLRGQVEDQQHQLKQLEQDQRTRYRDIDRRLSALIGAVAASTPPVPAVSAGVSSAVSPETQAGTGGDQAPASTDTAVKSGGAEVGAEVNIPASEDEVKAYQDAFALVRGRKFDEARQAFEAFIKQFSHSDRVANAYYWIGEVDLAQQQPAAARDAFNRVVTDFPKHIKVPDALYKLGVAYDQLGDAAASKKAFDRVIKEYPQSSAAGLARNYAGQ